MRASVKAYYKILLIFVVIGIAFFAVSCSIDIKYADPKVAAISIYSLSKVDGYVAGDELDISNAKILVTYDNGEQEVLDLTKEMIDFSSLDMTEPEDNKKVKVIYGGAETSFVISVKKWNFSKVELTSLPHKTIYIEGQSVDPTGAELSVYYEGDNVVPMRVTENMLESYSNAVGKRNIKINYFGAENLIFEVEFLKKAATRLEILREPQQVFVFQNYGDKLSREDMKIEIIYDNEVSEIYENAIMKSGSSAEDVSRQRALWKEKIDDNLYIDIDDWNITSKVAARVAYREPGLNEEIEYKYSGVAKVKAGDIVDVSTILATTYYMEDIKSISQGVVSEVSDSTIIVSRARAYKCNVAASRGNRVLDIGDIILKGEQVGTQAGAQVNADVAGIVVKKTNQEITVLAVPVSTFNIAVSDKSYKSMEIIKFPLTNIHATRVDSEKIIQGDTLNLETGLVRVTFDNGETAEYKMSDSNFITVKNESKNFRQEIPGLKILGANDVGNVPAGENYNLLYEFAFEDGYSYSPEQLKTVVSVLDENGNINVANNRTIVPEAGKNYIVSIMVIYIDNKGKTLINEASYMIATVGAPTLPERLDISAAGSHTLKIMFAAVDANSITFDIFVEQKVPVRIIIEEGTDNISQHNFYRGDSLPFSTIKYKLEYSNGDIDEISTGVTKNMVFDKSEHINDDFICTEIGSNQFIELYWPEHTSAEKLRLYFNVIPLPIKDLTVVEDPLDVFLTAKGITNGGTAGVTAIDLSGATFLVSYLKGSTKLLQDNNDNFLLTLFNNGKSDILPNIKIAYNPTDEAKLTEEEIYGGQKKHYIANLTYTDEYGETASTQIKYYIVERKPKAIKVSIEQSTAECSHKINYVQCENWDFTGMSLIVSYDGEGGSTITETVPLKSYMVYKTDTDSVGNEIPLIIRYFGMLEETPTVKFNVRERQETSIVLEKKGKFHYVTTGEGLDLTDYVFRITFNAGADQTINGIYSFEGNAVQRGWWYEVYDAEVPLGKTEPEPVLDNYGRLIRSNMRVPGDKMIRLFHTSELEISGEAGEKSYNINYIDFYVEVDIRETPITSISFDDTNQYKGSVPVLGKVAAGMPLVYTYLDTQSSTLKEKLLTLHYEDGTKGWIELSNKNVSVDYRPDDKSLGNRSVTVKYDKFECKLFVEVIDAKLEVINLLDAPTTSFINGDEFSIDGGILSATYKEKGSDLMFTIYVLMSDDNPLLTYNKIDCIIDEYQANGQYNGSEPRTITIEYGIPTNYATTSYEIIIYNKQDVLFSYSDVIFFYGNTADATVTAHQTIEGFVLPTHDDPKTTEDESNPNAIRKYYVSSEFFLYMSKEEYEIAKQSNPNLIEIVLWDKENEREIIAYYDLNNVTKYNGVPSRPYVPAKKGYNYYILMMVEGNTYYRTRNYCYQTYTIIPKVIDVNVVSANENAFVYRVFTNDNPTAIRSLYNDINAINSNWTSQYSYIQKIELASPNKDYFEILMTVTTQYNDSYYAQIVEIFNSINGQIQTYQKDGVKVSITKTTITRGVNIAEYSGRQPEYITYTVASGETLTYQGVLDLLEGKLEIVPIYVDGQEVFGIGDYKITNANGTLYHNNYNLEIITTQDTVFRVKKNIIESMVVEGNEASDWQPITLNQTLTIMQGDEIIVNVIVDQTGGIIRQARFYEIQYFTHQECRPEDLVAGELVAREEVYYAKLVFGYYLYYDQAEQEYKDYEFYFKVKVN